MKVNIWIKKEEVLSGNITEYHTHIPQVSYTNYVQVSITVDEFAKLEDGVEPAAMIHERNPDTNEIRSREIGKHKVGLGERVYTKEKDLDTLCTEMEVRTGQDFMTWFHKLTKNEQTTLAGYYNN